MSDSRRSGFSALLWAKKSVQEGTVDTKRLIGAIVAAIVILFLARFLVRGVWLGEQYEGARELTATGSNAHDAALLFTVPST